jgi:hypothetical protein
MKRKHYITTARLTDADGKVLARANGKVDPEIVERSPWLLKQGIVFEEEEDEPELEPKKAETKGEPKAERGRD